MPAPKGKPARSSPAGQPDQPIYARTSVLCNGQIAWKVGAAQDMQYSQTDSSRADLKPISDAIDDLKALNGLQIHRARPLMPLEVKQPLRHAQSCLPNDVGERIYTGDLYGSSEGVFSCSDEEFEAKAKSVFRNEVSEDGQPNYNDFFQRLRRAEYLLWDIEAEKGHWVAAIAHLHNGQKRHSNNATPASASSPDYNRVDEWCVVTTQRSPEGDAMVNRVKRRLQYILNEGNVTFDQDSEINPGIWVPMNEDSWSSGLRVYALIRTLMHRVTELRCKELSHRRTFWSPLPGWLNVDEVRAEMQGRAAQRCMAATDYRSRIAIEGVRQLIGVKETVRADELRPQHGDYIAYFTGKIGADGNCVPAGLPAADVNNTVDDDDDDDDGESRDSKPRISSGVALPKRQKSQKHKSSHFRSTRHIKSPASRVKSESDGDLVDDRGSDSPPPPSKKRKQGPLSQLPWAKKATVSTRDGELATYRGGYVGPPPKHVYGWDSETSEESDPLMHLPLAKLKYLSPEAMAALQPATPAHPPWTGKEGGNGPGGGGGGHNWGGPIGPPPKKVYGWETEDEEEEVEAEPFDPAARFLHMPLAKMPFFDVTKMSPEDRAAFEAYRQRYCDATPESEPDSEPELKHESTPVSEPQHEPAPKTPTGRQAKTPKSRAGAAEGPVRQSSRLKKKGGKGGAWGEDGS